MDKQNILQKEIVLLKNSIQEIIDKLDTTNEASKGELLLKKEEYKKKLNIALYKLQMHNECEKVLRESDSMQYHRLKKKENSNELINNIKKNRENAKENFEKIKLIENEYISKEIAEIPGFIFFNNEIISSYGICPHIKLTDNILLERKEWLNNTNDNGALYYNLYNKIVDKIEYNNLIKQKVNLEDDIIKIHSDILSQLQIELLQNIINSITQYNSSSIKSKRLKDKFKEVINDIDSLVSETNLDINEYLSEYYLINLPISINNNTENLTSKIYKDKIQEYKNVNLEIQSLLKFISNTTFNLKQLLYEHIFTESITTKKYIQVGKFCKKWSMLNNIEKLDRYESFSEFFVHKYLLEPKLIDNTNLNTIITSLKDLLKVEYINIKYKNIKWNVQAGNIEQIRCLKYNDTNNQFSLTSNIEIDKMIKVKKAISVRTILNKDTEKIVNEELLIFIVNSKKNNKLSKENIANLKDVIIEKLKVKLHLKRLTVNDKVQILKKFDEIHTIILNNIL